MKTLALLLIAVCFLTVGAQKRRRTSRKTPPAQTDPLDALFDPPVDKEGWAVMATESDKTVWKYRPGKTQRPSDMVRRLWAKVIPFDLPSEVVKRKERLLKIGLPAYRFNEYAYSIKLYEVNCSTREERITEYADYDVKGEFLMSMKNLDSPSEVPYPASIGEAIVDTACSDK